MSEQSELTDEYLQHLLDLCERTDPADDFSSWRLAIEAKTALPLLIAEVRRLRGAIKSSPTRYYARFNGDTSPPTDDDFLETADVADDMVLADGIWLPAKVIPQHLVALPPK